LGGKSGGEEGLRISEIGAEYNPHVRSKDKDRRRIGSKADLTEKISPKKEKRPGIILQIHDYGSDERRNCYKRRGRASLAITKRTIIGTMPKWLG